MTKRRAFLCAAFAPALVVVTAIVLRFDAPPTDFLPIWDDEIIYWNEVTGFARAGFDTGYVSVSGETPPAAFARFGPHGPAYTIAYGSLARIAGWQPPSAFIVNLLLVTAAALLWLAGRAEQVDWSDAVLVATFWPLLLYLPTHMQEPMHAAFALALAAAAWRLRTSTHPWRIWVWAAPLLALAALSRPTWAFALLAVGWPQAHRRRFGVPLLAVATVVFLLVAQALFSWLSTPYPNPQRDFVLEAQMSWEAALALLRRTTVQNVRLFFRSSNGEFAEVVFRYAVIAVLAVLAVLAWAKRSSAHAADTGLARAACAALAAPLALAFGFGQIEAWRDFRLLMPHVLFALLLGGAIVRPVRFVWFATLLFVPSYWTTFVEFHDQRFPDRHERLEEARAAFAPAIAYQPGANPWDNTVLADARALETPLMAIPPGVSIAYAVDWDDQPMPPKARYLWLRDRDLEEIGRPLRLSPLAVISSGTLYRNLDQAP